MLVQQKEIDEAALRRFEILAKRINLMLSDLGVWLQNNVCRTGFAVEEAPSGFLKKPVNFDSRRSFFCSQKYPLSSYDPSLSLAD